MSTMTTDAAVGGLDLVGRPAVVDQKLTTITAVDGSQVFTAREPASAVDAADVVVLPIVGEYVEFPDVIPSPVQGYWLGPVDQIVGEYVEMPDVIPSPVQGYWLGPVDQTRFGETFTALLLVGTGVTEVVMPTSKADARRIVTGAAGERAAMEALLAEARAHRCTRREHAAWVDRLVVDAHEEADDRGWCTSFDDFMDRAGLPRRTRDYDLCVEVTATVRVTRSASSPREAIDGLTREEVWAAMGADNIEWDAEED